MEKNEIISRVEEFLHNKYDAGGIDSELVEDCVDSTLAAINYTHSCETLPDRALNISQEAFINNCQDYFGGKPK